MNPPLVFKVPTNKALEVLESILQANSDIDAVFCGNDAMAMGAYQALVSAGKAEQVKVFGFDGADDVVKLIAEGKIVATGMQFPKVMAETAAESADKYIKGERNFPQTHLPRRWTTRSDQRLRPAKDIVHCSQRSSHGSRHWQNAHHTGGHRPRISAPHSLRPRDR
jgi:ABC-type sugar transport system substrate-binding protein